MLTHDIFLATHLALITIGTASSKMKPLLYKVVALCGQTHLAMHMRPELLCTNFIYVCKPVFKKISPCINLRYMVILIATSLCVVPKLFLFSW